MVFCASHISTLSIEMYAQLCRSFVCTIMEKCRAVAAVVLNDPDKIDVINVTKENRFLKLNNREIDVLIRGDADTLQREIREVSAALGTEEHIWGPQFDTLTSHFCFAVFSANDWCGILIYRSILCEQDSLYGE